MNPLYQEIPQNSIPLIGTQEREMLDLFMAGDVVPEQTLCEQFGRNYRSILQRLRGVRYGYWRFIDEKENGVIEARYIDPRHLSRDRHFDALARSERNRELKKDSFSKALNGAGRVQSAYEELASANEELEALKKVNAQQD